MRVGGPSSFAAYQQAQYARSAPQAAAQPAQQVQRAQAQAPAAPAQAPQGQGGQAEAGGEGEGMMDKIGKFLEQVMQDGMQEFQKLIDKGFSDLEKKNKERQAALKQA